MYSIALSMYRVAAKTRKTKRVDGADICAEVCAEVCVTRCHRGRTDTHPDIYTVIVVCILGYTQDRKHVSMPMPKPCDL